MVKPTESNKDSQSSVAFEQMEQIVFIESDPITSATFYTMSDHRKCTNLTGHTAHES